MIVASGYLPKVSIHPWIRVASSAVTLMAGMYFCFSGVLEFRRHKTTVDPRYPDNVSKFVDSGIYTLSRNPMYVGFALILISIVFFLSSPVLLLGVIAFVMYMNRFQIEPEEVHLSEAFGERYEAYKQKVRRWL